MSLLPHMKDVDQSSTDCLINNDTYINITRQQRKNNIFNLKIVLWSTILLSFMFATTSLMMFVFSNYNNSIMPQIKDFALHDAEFATSQLVESVRIEATHHAAKIIITRPEFPFMELHFSFHDTSDDLRIKRDISYDEPPESCEDEEQGNLLECILWPGPHGTRLTLDELVLDERAKCYNVTMMTASKHGTISTCFPLKDRQLYGGPIISDQRWPTQISKTFKNVPYLSGYNGIGGIAERFWLSSKGESIYIPPDIPLFLTQDTEQLCLESRLAPPYHQSNATSVSLNAVICSANTTRDVLLVASKALLGTPSTPPDSLMLKYPIWSTWARFKADINTKKVLKFAHDIKRFGFPNSQLEIDDRWEVCYGYSDFDNKTFPNANETIKSLQQLGFRVTLWMHPFENSDCYSYEEAKRLHLLVVRPEDNATDAIQWWDGRGGLIDFTKSKAADWFKQRLEHLKQNYNIDGFKFDAGESSFVPSLAILDGPEKLQPASLSTAYSKFVSQINPGMAEMRCLFMAQKYSLVVRMCDKSSIWGYNNGLKSLIPTLLNLNMIGYSTIMPDMIAGNGYSTIPDKELFIRWLQACVFMPVLQFSYAPWDYDDETVKIAKKYVDIHSKYHNIFTKLANLKMEDSTPINLPIWWIAPNDTVAMSIDSEYLLGEELLVAPVLEKGAVSRDIYLPTGTWREVLRPREGLFHGPIWIRNHPAPIDHLPFFELVQSNNDIDNEI